MGGGGDGSSAEGRKERIRKGDDRGEEREDEADDGGLRSGDRVKRARARGEGPCAERGAARVAVLLEAL